VNELALSIEQKSNNFWTGKRAEPQDKLTITRLSKPQFVTRNLQMIHHISIPAVKPQQVAEILALLWNGKVAPFPNHPGSFIAVAGDEFGTMIEVYPLGTELAPGSGEEEVKFQQSILPQPLGAIHAALSVPLNQSQIAEIAAKEGWRMVRCNRGPFEIIEFWVENRLLIELLTPELLPQYLSFMQPQNLQQFFAHAA
jgi:hypothetical protein